MTSLALRSIPRGAPAVNGPLLPGPMLAWGALFVNVMVYLRLPTVLPIPGPVGQMVAQGALPLALVLVLFANPHLVIRPNVVLGLLTAMAVVAFMVSIHGYFLVGSTYRGLRLLGFVLVLWLLTPWWGRSDLTLLRCHLRCLRITLVTVVVGAVLAPGTAFSYDGRLSGALWPIAPTQVAHFAAVLLGCTVVLWFTGLVRGRSAFVTVVTVGAMMLATHTRTALLGLALGLTVAGASLFVGHARVRRVAAAALVGVLLAGTVFAPAITTWLSRGQTSEQAYQLTGRTVVWSAIFEMPRPWTAWFFGSGLSDKSFNGLSIDSNWVASYFELGWFGVGVQVAILFMILLTAVTRPRGPRRAVALFLTVYCIVSSFTETGLGDASPYLLEVVVAASLLAPAAERSRP